MEPVTTRIDDETNRYVEQQADEKGVSKAEVLRELIERGMDYDDLERERDRLRSEKRTLINDREERTELVRYVEEQREADRHTRERRHAPAWRRAKWWLLGEPREESSESGEERA